MNKLQTTAEHVLKILGKFNLGMMAYNSAGLQRVSMLKELNVCGTTFCIAGYLAHDDGYPKEYCGPGNGWFSYNSYASDLIGVASAGSKEFQFFFSPCWADVEDAARERMEFVLEHGVIPSNFIYHPSKFIGGSYVDKRWVV